MMYSTFIIMQQSDDVWHVCFFTIVFLVMFTLVLLLLSFTKCYFPTGLYLLIFYKNCLKLFTSQSIINDNVKIFKKSIVHIHKNIYSHLCWQDGALSRLRLKLISNLN